jgi:hypothetical protein
MSARHGFARFLEALLAVYSVAVFATLAGAASAFFLEHHALAVFSAPRQQIHPSAGNPPRAAGTTALLVDVVSVV